MERTSFGPRLRLVGIGLLVVAVAAAILALASPDSSSQGPVPDVPIGTIPTSEDNWTAYPGPGNSTGVHILHVGSDAGFVLTGGKAPVCAHVVDGQGDNLEGAEVTFSAADGDFVPARVLTGVDGWACSTFLAPPTSGSVGITVRASRADLGTDEAQKTVEVVATASVDAGAIPAGIALVAVAAGISLLGVAPSKDSPGGGRLQWRGRLALGSLWLVVGAALFLATASQAPTTVDGGAAHEHAGADVSVADPSPYAVPAMAVGIVGALLVASGFPQSVRNRRAPRLRAAKLAALLLLLADGVIHLYASTDHAFVPVFAAFFFAVGLGQVALPPLVVRKTGLLVWFGIWTSVGLIALFAYTRISPPPFHDEPEPVETLGLASKALEVAIVAVLAYIFLRARSARLRSRSTRSRDPPHAARPGTEA